MSRQVLFVVTSHSSITKDISTGLWLEEYAIPYEIFKQKGYKIDTASLTGGNVPLDPNSLSSGDSESFKDAMIELQQTIPLQGLIADHYDVLFIPGGHGTMFDLANSVEFTELLMDFEEKDKLIASVCHGPACFAQAKYEDGTPFVSGKQITAFTNEEEREVQLDEYMPFLLEEKLQELGAKFIATPNWQVHIQKEGNLITGQNPQSSKAVAETVVSYF
ncbi:type 1 glutamine amidotransferase domain-containing protein [Peribacillus alkalitolerans]|uniref:type 1 glutamine amidotransferase domain-containing protein n=1 Tax=Peribacillus alkalitolerans TaxID=1550385 RepID=UPI0013D55C7F|nr:type 1 glutamine amidotransferase domain-containing protein [Peribacillus alkalitolerans]